MRPGIVRKATVKGAERASENPAARFCAACAPGDVAGRDPAAHLRQQHRAGGDGDDAERQLIEPVGIVERRDRPGRQPARDDRVGEGRDLESGRSDHGRAEHFEEALQRRIEPRHGQRRHHPDPAAAPPQQEELQHARDRDAPGGGIGGVREQDAQRQRRQHGEVQEHRCPGRHGEVTVGIEDARQQGHQGHEQEVGEGDPRQRHRQGEALAPLLEARRQGMDDVRHQRQGEVQQHELNDQHQGEDPVGEAPGGPRGARLREGCIGRDEGGVERPLAEDRTEVVRQAEGDDEGVGDRPGAHDGRHHHVPGEAGDAGDERPPADGEDGADHGWAGGSGAEVPSPLRGGVGVGVVQKAPPRFLRLHPTPNPSRKGEGKSQNGEGQATRNVRWSSKIEMAAPSCPPRLSRGRIKSGFPALPQGPGATGAGARTEWASAVASAYIFSTCSQFTRFSMNALR